MQVLFRWNDLESSSPTNAVKICAMNVQKRPFATKDHMVQNLNWYMVSEFFKSLTKAFQSLKPMVTGPLFTPVPFYGWKSKIIFAMCAISMYIAVSQ